MKNKIAQWQIATLLAAGISMNMISTLHAAAPVLYELHSTGSVWGYTGVPCNGKVCSGWEMLDDETTTIQIAAGNGTLYQRHTDGSVWQWTGAVCNGNACNRWTQIGSNAANILAAGSNVYLYNQNGFYQFTGGPCTNPSFCPGWIGIDYDPYAVAYYVQDYTVVKINANWANFADEFFQYTCNNRYCPGWVLFGGVPLDSGPPLALAPGLAATYEVSSNGATSVYGQPCVNGSCTWAEIGDSTNTVQITAGNGMYQLQNDGTVLQYTGTPCNGTNCNGWLQLDKTPAISYIIAGPNTVYEQHKDGSIWQYTGPCNFCLTGWTELDNNPLTVSVVPGY